MAVLACQPDPLYTVLTAWLYKTDSLHLSLLPKLPLWDQKCMESSQVRSREKGAKRGPCQQKSIFIRKNTLEMRVNFFIVRKVSLQRKQARMKFAVVGNWNQTCL